MVLGPAKYCNQNYPCNVIGCAHVAANRLGRLRSDHEALLTFEGDNNVILLQTANYLLDLFRRKTAGGCGLITRILTMVPVLFSIAAYRYEWDSAIIDGLSTVV